MHMADMQKPKPKPEDKAKLAAPTMPESDKYPYGLRLNLGKDEIKKLGCADCKVGDVMKVVAMAKVTSMRASDTEHGQDQSMELQITRMGMGPDSDAEMDEGFQKKEA